MLTNEELSTSIAETVWGHRFRSGQRGVEYTLEFLNVMAGTDYNFNAPKYKRKKMIGFRQFVFEGEKEGRDNNNYVSFSPEAKGIIKKELKVNNNELNDIQDFLKNLKVEIRQQNGAPTNRSWYAQFLFPLHESMLFFELRNKNGSISYEHNFFSRGGELYYLALSNGLKNNPALANSIKEKIEALLSSNKNIGNLISRINRVIAESCYCSENTVCEKCSNTKDTKESNENAYLYKPENLVSNTNYPKLAVNESPLFNLMAEELDSLLEARLDIHDTFRYLTSLICIQLYRYMIDRCNQIQLNGVSDKMGDASDYCIFMDCTDGQNKQIKHLAEQSYKSHQHIVKLAFDKILTDNIQKRLPIELAIEKIQEWKKAAANSEEKVKYKKYEEFFKELGYNRLKEKKKNLLISAIENPDENSAYNMLLVQMKAIAGESQSKNDFAILNVLGKDGGFYAGGVGTTYRYSMSDTLINALVLALLGNEKRMTFDAFKRKLFESYHIVIGTAEADLTNVIKQKRVSFGTFKENELRFRQKLKKNGLLEEFSDATAFIVNPAYFMEEYR